MRIGNTFPNFKEEFRAQLIQAGVADDCVIDKDTFAEISCVSGCFKSGNTWTVYDTDEKAEVSKVKEYPSEQAAFADLAMRLGFSYALPIECIISDGKKDFSKVVLSRVSSSSKDERRTAIKIPKPSLISSTQPSSVIAHKRGSSRCKASFSVRKNKRQRSLVKKNGARELS